MKMLKIAATRRSAAWKRLVATRAVSNSESLCCDEFSSSRRQLDTRFAISNFERSVLGCIDADNLEQIVVGKIALDEIYAFHIFLVAFPFNILQKAQTFSKTISDKISSTNC